MNKRKCTIALIAAGMSMGYLAQSEETSTALLTALSSTTVSGYVDVSAHWNPGTGTGGPAYAFAGGKRDGFNLNVVSITLEKPLEEAEWSAGYKVDLLLGPDAPIVTGGGAIRQAYVALRAPVGNGLDFKIGQWDSILGYESTDSYKNPNYTRSYEYTLTPTEHTGILASYHAADFVTLNAGVANVAQSPVTNVRSPRAESHKTYMGSIVISAPDSWGALAGSSLTLGVIDGFGAATADFTQYYAGATIKTGIEGLSVGAAYSFFDDVAGKGTDTYTVNGYISFKATEKLGLHLRGEYGHGAAIPGLVSANPEIIAATATIQYDIWENVLSRLELRWDHDASGSPVRPWNGRRNDYLVAANFVYKF